MTKNPIRRGLRILWERITRQGIRPTALWAVDHAARLISGANISRLSQITPQLHVGGQFRRRGWRRLAARGITAVVNMRRELDDRDLGIAPPRYLYLPTVDDQAPTLEQLREGVTFIENEVSRGGAVYIHCGAGVGRAATMAVAYLIHRGLMADEAWARVRRIRPFVRPTAAQIAQLERFAEQV